MSSIAVGRVNSGSVDLYYEGFAPTKAAQRILAESIAREPDIVDYQLKEGPHAGRHAIQHFYYQWGWSNARTIGALLTGETAVRDVRWTPAASWKEHDHALEL
jgi:hypothetical protein